MIVPALHRILVKQDSLEEHDVTYKRMKDVGLVIPEMEQHQRAQAGVDTGTVVDIGETAFRDFNTESPVAKGDRIAYARFSGKQVKDPDTQEQFVVLNDEDVVCVFK